MRKPTTIFLVLALAGCADESEPECTRATEYNGPAITCESELGSGVCVTQAERIACLPLCADTGPACEADHQWRSIAVSDGAPVCYCEHVPTAHVWIPIIRDHR